MRQLKLLSYNVQAGIYSRQYSDYLVNSWKYVLPHQERQTNLDQIGRLVRPYDVVGLQEVDSGSLRSSNIDQILYLARQAAFPFWYRQINRDLGPFAQHSNGILSRLRPSAVTEHRLPGLPGRGAVVVEFPLVDGSVLAVAAAHLALGWRARKRQLDYLAGLAGQYPYLVLMGDFNCGCASRELREMVERVGLNGLNCELKTFPSWKPKRSLDHILITPSLRMVSAEVIDYPLSDHLPLAMTIELPEPLEFMLPQAATA